MNIKRFTLIELISVIVVISILAAIVLINVGKAKDRAITSYVGSNVSILQTAVDMYFLENEKYPILNNNEVFLENPQYVDIEKLVKEGYLKKDLDFSKVATQYYWVDVFGRVWGATEDTLSKSSMVLNPDKKSQTFTVTVKDNYEKLVLYKVKNAQNIKVADLKLQNLWASSETVTDSGNKVTYNVIKEWDAKGEMNLLIQIDDIENTYLVGAIDRFNLETVPVGAGYNPEKFKPIRGELGEFEYRIESNNLKHWVDFLTTEDTPNNSKIDYEFSIKKERNGSYSDFTKDFYSLESAYGLIVKIKLSAGTDGAKPSLYSLKVIYNTDKEIKENNIGSGTYIPSVNGGFEGGNPPSEYSGSINTVLKESFEEVCLNEGMSSRKEGNKIYIYYNYYVNPNEVVTSIDNLKPSIPNLNLIATEISMAKKGSKYEQIRSYADIKSDHCVSILFLFEGNSIVDIPLIESPIFYLVESNSDLVLPKKEVTLDDEISSNNPTDKEGSNNKEGIPNGASSSDKEVYNEQWETILDFRLFQQGTQELTTWYGYRTDEDYIQDKTRVIYRFATGNGYYWTGESKDFPFNSSSNAIMVHVYLQVKKEFMDDNTIPDPKFNWIEIHSSEGYSTIDQLKPQVLIYPKKDNNAGRDTISNSSNVTWHYEAQDPNGYKITDVEWSPALNSGSFNYTVGNHSIRARVKNELGIWSNWTTYHFNVKEEKPVAAFDIVNGITYIPINEKISFNTSISYDPDGDGITNFEWMNKKDKYTQEDIGQKTISLRVQDSEGNWSDWVSKQVYIYDASENLWFVNGEPAIPAGFMETFDDRDGTYNHHKTPPVISWNEDLSGRTIVLKMTTWSQYTLWFENDKGEKLEYLSRTNQSNAYSYNKDSIIYTYDNFFYIIIPEGATKMIIPEGNVQLSIRLLEENKVENVFSDINVTPSTFKASIHWKLNSTSVDKVLIQHNGNLIQLAKEQTTGEVISLLDNTNYVVDLIAVDSNGRIINSEKVLFKTNKNDLEWYVNGVPYIEAGYADLLDGDANSYQLINGRLELTWTHNTVNNRQYRFAVQNMGYATGKIYFLDEFGEKILVREHNQTYSVTEIVFGYYNGYTLVTIPENAVKMIVESNGRTLDISRNN